VLRQHALCAAVPRRFRIAGHGNVPLPSRVIVEIAQ